MQEIIKLNDGCYFAGRVVTIKSKPGSLYLISLEAEPWECEWNHPAYFHTDAGGESFIITSETFKPNPKFTYKILGSTDPELTSNNYRIGKITNEQLELCVGRYHKILYQVWDKGKGFQSYPLSDGTISIRNADFKTNWNKEEVKAIVGAALSSFGAEYSGSQLSEWLNNNLKQ